MRLSYNRLLISFFLLALLFGHGCSKNSGAQFYDNKKITYRDQRPATSEELEKRIEELEQALVDLEEEYGETRYYANSRMEEISATVRNLIDDLEKLPRGTRRRCGRVITMTELNAYAIEDISGSFYK
ncbi:MAG: hypothetical protein KF881_03675 [Acidobacteria bacterium]|nr:hypothetical protein [Acidobacteriota bacterium]